MSCRNRKIKYLNACCVHFDCRGIEQTVDQTAEAVNNLGLAGRLPAVSMAIISGHELWVLWLLRDETAPVDDDPHVLPPSQRAWPEMQDLYRRTERAIVRMPELRAIGCNLRATGMMGLIPIPGSLNTATGTVARVLPQLSNDRLPIYTLRELAAWWQVA